MKIKHVIPFLLLTLIIQDVDGQQSNKVSIGVGYLDLINVSYEYRINQWEIGASAGGLFEGSQFYSTFSLNTYYHFAGHSKFNEIKPWFLRAGIQTLRSNDQYKTSYHFYYSTRLGREFNFNEKIGLSMDIGASFFDIKHGIVIKKKEPPVIAGILYVPILPAASLKLFYRL